MTLANPQIMVHQYDNEPHILKIILRFFVHYAPLSSVTLNSISNPHHPQNDALIVLLRTSSPLFKNYNLLLSELHRQQVFIRTHSRADDPVMSLVIPRIKFPHQSPLPPIELLPNVTIEHLSALFSQDSQIESTILSYSPEFIIEEAPF